MLSDDGVSSSPIVITNPKKVLKIDNAPQSSSMTDASNGNPVIRPMAPCRASRGEATLHHPFPAQSGPYELCILVQPEQQHRARYQTEGSRGAIKDQSQASFPKVQACNNDPFNYKQFHVVLWNKRNFF